MLCKLCACHQRRHISRAGQVLEATCCKQGPHERRSLLQGYQIHGAGTTHNILKHAVAPSPADAGPPTPVLKCTCHEPVAEGNWAVASQVIQLDHIGGNSRDSHECMLAWHAASLLGLANATSARGEMRQLLENKLIHTYAHTQNGYTLLLLLLSAHFFLSISIHTSADIGF